MPGGVKEGAERTKNRARTAAERRDGRLLGNYHDERKADEYRTMNRVKERSTVGKRASAR